MHSEKFKIECVSKLELLQELGTINIKGVQIKNVRELVNFLGISSFSIYKWQKEFEYNGIVVSNESDSNLDLFEGVISQSEKEALMPTLEYDDSIDDSDDTIDDSDDTITMVLDNTYFMTLARALKVKNYRMPLKQLYVAIGNELIKRSGLVENGVKKELRLK